jgi:crotonobetainyl-CoA:carnitine CoA-transferase CaiB-like acyl-CoA transferase
VYLDYINFPMSMMSQGRIKPHRFGGDFYSICPYGVYRSREGYLVLAVMQHQWGPLVRVMGQPELEHDPRYATQEARCEVRPQVRAIVEAWLQSQPDDATALKNLAEAHIPSAPILEIPQVPEHPQIKARGLFQDLTHPDLGVTPVARMPFQFSTVSTEIPFRAPYLGEHNAEILRKYLGYEEDRVAALYTAGTLVEDGRLDALRKAGQV